MLERLHRYGTIVFVFLVLALGVRDLMPHGTLGLSDEVVANARQHLEVIARETRPSGSQANASVRTYLRGQLERMDLEVEEQTWTQGEVSYTNLLTRVPGSDPTGALLVLAHHDSVVGSPGAADDGSGCVTILEVARALADAPPLRQDVLLLITDGEERGLYGAKRFRDEHPAMQDVRAVINLEAMGGAGPLVCFQMSRDNADLVRAWSEAPQPVGSSFAEFVYSNMPNDSDLTVFLGRVPGMNFALVGGCSVYHQPYDTAAKVEDRSLRHEIATVLSCVRTLADGEWREDAPARNWFQWPFLGTLDWSETPPEWGVLSILGLLLVLDTPGTRSRRALAIVRGIAFAALALVLVALPAFALGFLYLFTQSGLKGPNSYFEVHTMVALQGAWALIVLALFGRWSKHRADRAGWILEASLSALLVASLGGVFYHVQGVGIRDSDALPLRAMVTLAALAFVFAQRAKGATRWVVAALLVPVALTFAPLVSILPQIGSQLEWLAAAMGAVLFALFALLVSPMMVAPIGSEGPVPEPRPEPRAQREEAVATASEAESARA